MGDYRESGVRAEVETIFFKAMRAGYAAKTEPNFEPGELRNEKITKYEEDGWFVRDRWVAGEAGLSAGWTLITYCSNPVWHMQYWGRYAKEAIPFLKAALRKNYDNDLFLGGRGPAIFTSDEFPRMGYVNGAQREPFARFWGMEAIKALDEKGFVRRTFGYHQYQGGYLFGDE